jgi:hypothetical protein
MDLTLLTTEIIGQIRFIKKKLCKNLPSNEKDITMQKNHQ